MSICIRLGNYDCCIFVQLPKSGIFNISLQDREIKIKLCGWEQELGFNNGLFTSLNKYHKDKGYLDGQKVRIH